MLVAHWQPTQLHTSTLRCRFHECQHVKKIIKMSVYRECWKIINKINLIMLGDIYPKKNAGSSPATSTATCQHTPVPVLHMPGCEEIIKISVYRECWKIINKINIMIYIAKMLVARWQLAHPHACTLPCWFYECQVEKN